MRTKEGGFTVLELLISIALIGIIIPTVYLAINSLLVINKRSRNISLVNIAAENKVESLRSTGYNNIPSGTSSFSSELPDELSSPKNATLVISTSNGKKVIDINISFRDFDRQRSVQYKTIISETGVGQ
jgi:type II secretory pathway pseudopilin PulG